MMKNALLSLGKIFIRIVEEEEEYKKLIILDKDFKGRTVL